jgi:predicted Zn-dependent protease
MVTKALRTLAFAAATLAATAGCLSAWPAESERIGARDHPAILAQYGGEIADTALAAYVASIGQTLVRGTDKAAETWHFTVLDSPVVNAFALPGGRVYVTRGLLALANSEAELAGVLGHEIGHVIAGHGEDRIRRGNRVGIGVIVGVLIGGLLNGSEGMGDAAEWGMSLAQGYLARHSQTEEFEADAAGIRLLAWAGYDPEAQATFLGNLGAQEALDRRMAGQDAGAGFDFFASHPSTDERVRRAGDLARKSAHIAEPRTGRAAYLGRIDGLTFGDKPEEGFVRGRRFSHPNLGFTFLAPEGFTLTNTPQQVIAAHPGGARMILDGDARWPGAMSRYIADRWLPALRQSGVIAEIDEIRDITVSGLDAATTVFPVQTQAGPRIAQLTAIRLGDMTIRFIALSEKTDGGTRNAMNSAAQGFRALTKAEIAALRPLHLKVVTVGSRDTLATLSRGFPQAGFREEAFLTLNGLARGAIPARGDVVKSVD